MTLWCRAGVLLLVAAVCLGQGAAPQSSARGGDQPADAAGLADDRAELRARLERRLEESRRVQSRIEAAIKRLDEGESLESVREDVEPRRFADGRGRGRPGPGAPPGERPRPDREEILRFIETHNAELGRRLRAALKENPGVVERMIERLEPQMRDLMAERDEETRALRIAEMSNGFETLGAMRQYAEARRAGRDASAEEMRLRTLIGEHFDLQLKLREREIARLDRRLAQLRSELEERRPQRDAIVEQRLERIKRGAMHTGAPKRPGDKGADAGR